MTLPDLHQDAVVLGPMQQLIRTRYQTERYRSHLCWGKAALIVQNPSPLFY
jgi:hypothetical protein